LEGFTDCVCLGDDVMVAGGWVMLAVDDTIN
jgi:hypothetical protein